MKCLLLLLLPCMDLGRVEIPAPARQGVGSGGRFGAAEDHAFRAGGDEVADDALGGSLRVGTNVAEADLFVDHAVDLIAVGGWGRDLVEA